MTLKPYDIMRILSTLAQVQAWHWQSQSYAQHVALGEFYAAFQEKADALVETASKWLRIDIDPKLVELAPLTEGADALFIGGVLSWLFDLQKRIQPGESALLNLVADLIGITQHTAYKLSLK